MPKPGSKFHVKIINAAYDKDPAVAVKLIKTLIILTQINSLSEFATTNDGKLRNELGQEVEVDTSDDKQVTLKNGGAKIIMDGSFQPLYDTSRFNIFVIESGEIGIDNPISNDNKTINKKPNSFKSSKAFNPMAKGGTVEDFMNNEPGTVTGGRVDIATPDLYDNAPKLISGMLKYDIDSRTIASSKPAFIPKMPEVNVFTAMAVSFLDHVNTKGTLQKYLSYLHINPMCICSIICHFAGDDYQSWSTSNNDTNVDYTYSRYLEYVKQQTVSTIKLNHEITNIITNIKERNIGNILDIVKTTYSKRYGAELEEIMICYHESLFVLNSYLRCIVNKDTPGMKKYAEIYEMYYCKNSTPMLLSESVLTTPLAETAVICKAFEFIRSDTFLHPNSDDSRATISVSHEPSVDFDTSIFEHSELVNKVFNV
jgi:hypothetical protein